ncbi:MAG: Sir2 family NAD-dependent protein deacetylase [Spirochaetes bacterium]|nr:Sir2 family NAD-dependent protein deacetylase [Spirochaetota bacterium]
MDTGNDQKLVDLLKSSNSILIFTGAGVSTGSGIPDFRGPQGVWRTKTPVYYQDFMGSEDARRAYWEQKLEGWEKYRDAQPNPVHLAVVRIEQAEKLLMVVTQNIDGLHTKAGISPGRLVELHGTMNAVECQTCHRRDDPDMYFQEFRKKRKPLLCSCGGHMKSATISFGQSLRKEDLERAWGAADQADLVIALGSTLSVTPAAQLPLQAVQRGVPYVIINRGTTEHDALPQVTLRLEGDVREIFPQAVEQALS